jgi:hypothetical protein
MTAEQEWLELGRKLRTHAPELYEALLVVLRHMVENAAHEVPGAEASVQ